MIKKTNKKGSINMMAVVMIVAIVSVLWIVKGNLVEVSDGSFKASSTPDVGIPNMALSLSSITSGVLEKEISDNNFKLKVSDSELNSENTTSITFTLDSKAQNGFRSNDGSYISHQIVYGANVQKFGNVDDLTDSTEYHPVDYVDNTNLYNINTSEASYITVNQASETVKLGSPATTVYTIAVEDYTTLKKGTEDSFDELVLGNFPITVDGQKVGSVQLIYGE